MVRLIQTTITTIDADENDAGQGTMAAPSNR